MREKKITIQNEEEKRNYKKSREREIREIEKRENDVRECGDRKVMKEALTNKVVSHI